MDRARMMADSCELPWFGIFRIIRVQDSFCGPYAHVAVYVTQSVTLFGEAHRVRALRTSGGSCKALSIRRYVTAVYFDVFQITCIAHRSQQVFRNRIGSFIA